MLKIQYKFNRFEIKIKNITDTQFDELLENEYLKKKNRCFRSRHNLKMKFFTFLF